MRDSFLLSRGREVDQAHRSERESRRARWQASEEVDQLCFAELECVRRFFAAHRSALVRVMHSKMRRPEDYVPVIARPAKKRQSTSIAGRPYAASEPAHSDEEAEEEGEQQIGGSQPILRSVPMVRSLAQSRRV